MQDELVRLQGRWNVISLEMNGAPLPPDAFAGAKVLIEDNKFTSIGMGSTYKGIIGADGSNDPKTFSMKFTDGPETDNTNFGIFELEENNWRICLAIQPRSKCPRMSSCIASLIAQKCKACQRHSVNLG